MVDSEIIILESDDPPARSTPMYSKTKRQTLEDESLMRTADSSDLIVMPTPLKHQGSDSVFGDNISKTVIVISDSEVTDGR
jgi:hypothetical protein